MTQFGKTRMKWLFAGVAVMFLGIVGRVVYVNTAMRPRLVEMRRQQYKRIIKLPARRGIIRDNHGRKLAMDVSFTSIYAVPNLVKDKERTVARLSQMTGVRKDLIRMRLNRPKEFVWIVRRTQDWVAQQVKAAKMDGVGFMDEPRRVYPNGQALAAVVGFMGVDSGAEGVERNYEKMLRGRDGVIEMERDAIGRSIPNTISRREPFRDGK